MVVYTINGQQADIHGNARVITTSLAGDTRDVKMWCGTATVNSGGWSVDYTAAGFSQIKNIQLTVQGSIATDADVALSAMVSTFTTSIAGGKAFRVTSAGLLAAMQQTAAVNGTIVNVLVIGH